MEKILKMLFNIKFTEKKISEQESSGGDIKLIKLKALKSN